MFSIDDIKQSAISESGLNDFGSGEYEEPLSVLINAYNEVKFSPEGKEAVRRDLITDLIARLRVVEGLKRAPEALERKIERPLFILGFPRTGTTTLHNLIQADPNCQVLENWIGILPKSRPPRASWQSDRDYLSIEEALRAMYEVNPELRAQHDIDADSADECRFLFKQMLMDDGYGYLCDIPSYSDWLDKQSMKAAYEWHKNALKLIQFPHDTDKRWVLKYPTHMAWITELFEAYPDACIIQTHRDPAATIPSFASLICGAAKTLSDGRTAEKVGPFLAKQWHNRVESFMKARTEMGREDQFFDIQFSDVVNDPVQSVRKAYEHFDIPFSDETETAMRDWATNHPPGRHGSHKYTAEEFGLDFDELSAMFSSYRDRYNVPAAKP